MNSVKPRAPSHVALVALGLLAVVAGCAATPKPEPAAPPPPKPASPAAEAKPPEPAPPLPETPTASAIHIDDAILAACGIEAPKAFFAFDSANVQGQDTSTLEKVATCFASGPLKGRSLKLVGHADPRGETEYNFVLGSSRADAVGGFLRSKGVDKAKIATTSRGELDATGSDESTWARDRRVDVMLAPQ
jgi:peptidoglycan-associated lipoprotein